MTEEILRLTNVLLASLQMHTAAGADGYNPRHRDCPCERVALQLDLAVEQADK